MLRAALLVLVLGFVGDICAAEPPAGLADLRWLIGEWRGVGEGEPGTSASERHADSFLDGRYLRVSGRSVYPRQPKNPQGEIHGQLDIWSYDRAYVLDKTASAANRWVLVAESLENLPKGLKARYIYTRASKDEYQEVLELDADGTGFKAYVSNRFLRVEATDSPSR